MAKVESFFGNPSLRERLLDDVKAEGLLSTLWLKGAANGSVIEVLASEHNLDRSLFKLLSVLAGSRLDETSGAFLTKALEAIPLDGPSDGMVARWLLEVCAPVVAARLGGTAAAQALGTVVALVQRAHLEAIDETEWRSARRSMIFVEGLTPLQAAYADVAAAMAWNLDRYPGAIADVLEAWEESVRKEILLSEGWTDEIDADFHATLVEAHGKVAEVIQKKRVAGEELTGDYIPQILQDHFEACGKLDLYQRSGRILSEAQAAADEWHSQRQEEYLLFAVAGPFQ